MDTTSLIKQTEDLIFNIGQQAPYKDLHSKALKILKELYNQRAPKDLNRPAPIKNRMNENHDNTQTREQEVEKAKAKLPKWANSPNQICSKILSAYLLLENSGHKTITKGLLEEAVALEFGEIKTFQSNFDQMKRIYEKNNAKVFDVDGRGIITIWPPVKTYVEEYKKIALINTGRIKK